MKIMGELSIIFLIDNLNGELKLGGPEQDRQSSGNIYRLEWVSLEKVKDLKLLPDSMKEKFLEEFCK